MKPIQSLGGRQRRLKRLVRKLGIPRLFGILIAFSLICQFWILPALTQQPVVITMLMQGQDRANWQPFLEEFDQNNPDIRLNLVEGPFDTNLQENLLTSAFLLGDSPYDILNLDIVWVPKFAAAGWLRPLDDRISPEQVAELIENNIEGGATKANSTECQPPPMLGYFTTAQICWRKLALNPLRPLSRCLRLLKS